MSVSKNKETTGNPTAVPQVDIYMAISTSSPWHAQAFLPAWSLSSLSLSTLFLFVLNRPHITIPYPRTHTHHFICIYMFYHHHHHNSLHVINISSPSNNHERVWHMRGTLGKRGIYDVRTRTQVRLSQQHYKRLAWLYCVFAFTYNRSSHSTYIIEGGSCSRRQGDAATKLNSLP